MIRFCDKELVCMPESELNKSILLSYFLRGHIYEPVCVTDNLGKFRGMLTYQSLLVADVEHALCTDFVVADADIWKNARQFFQSYRTNLEEIPLLPVLDKTNHLIAFAYQDEDADRELRMLRELTACHAAIGYAELYPLIDCITIEGCNELAFYFYEYLRGQGIPVSLTGDMWQELGVREEVKTFDFRTQIIYAEGVWQKTDNIVENLLRSVSVEFECIDKVYHENIKQGRITDAAGDFKWLCKRLKCGSQIFIKGTGEAAWRAYILLKQHDIHVDGFVAEKELNDRQRIFGKRVLDKYDIWMNHKDAMIVDADSKYSAWGIGEVDKYDYMGFLRNESYFALLDYIENWKCSVAHLFENERVVLAGNVSVCRNLYKRLCRVQGGPADIRYCAPEEEMPADIGMQVCTKEQIGEDDICLFMNPEYITRGLNRAEYEKERYTAIAEKCGFTNYKDFFVKNLMWMSEETANRERGRNPKGVIIGAINSFSGNVFFRGLLDGHPEILQINYGLLNDNLFLFCKVLSEEKTERILPAFWELYGELAGEAQMRQEFCCREKFDNKMTELLKGRTEVSSQELFVMFHVAYASMYEERNWEIEKTFIYWEPHIGDRKRVAQYTAWFAGADIKVWCLRGVRNSCVRAGSIIKAQIRDKKKVMRSYWELVAGYANEDYETVTQENEIVIRFEDIKQNPREVLSALCEKWQISWSDTLLSTTSHGKSSDFYGVRDFDLKPVYNTYEEYLSGCDRLRINLLCAPWQKRYGYFYEHISDYSRRELQELFLKKYRFADDSLYVSLEQKLIDMLYDKRWERDYLQRAWRMEILGE